MWLSYLYVALFLYNGGSVFSFFENISNERLYPKLASAA
jgi:hypothetical protein